MRTPPNPDEILAGAKAGRPYDRGEEPQPVIYEPGELVCSLTLDQKQAWVLFVLLKPYDTAEPGDWDIYRAGWDVRRRVAEALGYE